MYCVFLVCAHVCLCTCVLCLSGGQRTLGAARLLLPQCGVWGLSSETGLTASAFTFSGHSSFIPHLARDQSLSIPYLVDRRRDTLLHEGLCPRPQGAKVEES